MTQDTEAEREELAEPGMLPIPSPQQCVDDLRDDGFHPQATCVARLMREANYHQQEIDGLVSKSRYWQARAEKAEAAARTAYARGIEDAARAVAERSYAAREKLGRCVSEGHAEDGHVWSAIVSHLDLARDAIRAALTGEAKP